MKTANSATIVQGRGRKQQTTLEKINLALSKQEKIQEKRLGCIYAKLLLAKKSRFQQYPCIKYNYTKHRKYNI